MEVAESRRCMNLKRNIGGVGEREIVKSVCKKSGKKNEG